MKSKLRKSLFEVRRESYVKEESIKKDILDCSLGTNPYGFPHEILEGISLHDFDCSIYPSPYNDSLKEALVEYWKGTFDKEEVFIGTGSMGCLEKVNKFAIREGSKVLGYAPQFSEYITEVRIMGGVYEYMSLKKGEDFEFNYDEFIGKINDNYTLVYIDNPNNPTGQVIPLDVIEDITKKALEKEVIVVVDEAYGDFMDIKNSAVNLEYPNLIVVRSFSKGFGLANLRVGYAVIKGRDLREIYSKVNLPFQISTLAEIFAINAIQHRKFIQKCTRKISNNKKKLLNYMKNEFNISATAMEVPIVLLWKEGVNLYEYLLKRDILTVNGADFAGLDSSYVRLRIPQDIKMLIKRFGE